MAQPAGRGRGRGYPDRGRGGFSPASSDSGYRGRGYDRGRGGDRGRGRGGFGGGRGAPPGIYAPAGRTNQIDARLRDNSENELVASLKNVKIDTTDLPLRPDHGKAGKAVALRTNYFPVTIPKGPFYEYEIVIMPTVSIKRVRRRILELAEDTQDWKATLAGSVAHDHSAKLVARKQLPESLTIRVPFYDEDEDPPAPGAPAGKEYTLVVKFVQELETESLKRVIAGDPQYRTHDIMPIISAFNLILAAHPTRSGGGGVMVGRNKFFMPSNNPSMPLGGGLEAVRGFYSSVRTAHRQLMVNVNVCTTAFYKPGNLADALSEFLRTGFGARATAFVKGLRIKATHLGYRKTIKRAVDDSARSYKFDSGEYGTISVEEYFRKKYKITLRYPELPLVDVGGQKINYLPAELCEIIPHQPFRGKLLDEHTANMITYAAKPPNVNAQAIESQGLQELGFNQDTPTLNAFGVGVGKEMAVVPGRILNAPKIKYAQDTDASDYKADRASWSLRQVRFTKAALLDNWAVLLIRDGGRDDFAGPTDPKLREILTGFADMCKKSGMTVKSLPAITEAQLPPKDRTDPMRAQAIAKIREALTKGLKVKPRMVLVILSSSDNHIYSGLKHLCDVGLDVATVCVQAGKIRGGGPQYYANVALKVNVKLGGVNHTLDKTSLSWLKEQHTMLVGIDVTHPGLGSVKGTPSIAAVVGSVDVDYAQFPASLRMQESRKEMVTALEDMMGERLKVFFERRKVYPERILVYRDGVSEGQFAIVIEEEMPAIIAACRKIRPNYRPKLTIVVCGKRHHTRFFPAEEKAADGKANPLPGTVVDRGITSVYLFDFFLQAHGSLQGTSKPTHYHVIHDEIGFTADKIQTLTDNISHMFARATKAVSLVSPAYYADLACERGRCYLHEMLLGFRKGNITATSADDEQVRKEAAESWGRGPTGNNIKNIMFYL
ncbi:argonaute-like protein [Macrolepiota fuliginosa MF-IS2]|uniref:Argonaute-like protein n=1 Tax=Macrolepiota fuliginosa MF-IS2 TaxID=1400762 RepID=A0A9P5X7H7_9AGAR|nr:argonaute-like protein [Macrolepiota fuliginosa MF-IS2]